MEMKTIITKELLDGCRRHWAGDLEGQRAANSIIQNGPPATAMDHRKVRNLNYAFSVDLEDKGITDQGRSSRCWAFASLNVMRQNVVRALNLNQPDFELSQNFTYFYDQLEKCAEFLEDADRLSKEDTFGGELLDLCRSPIEDNGQWYIFAKLLDRYGVVPKSVMPDTECSMDTRFVSRILGRKLRLSAKEIREAAPEQRQSLKEQQMADIYGILCRFLGEPPEKFTYEYRDREGNFHRLKDITPVEFARRYGDMPVEEYMFIIHHPLEERPYHKTYVTRKDKDQSPGPDVMLNLPIDVIKDLVIRQLKGGEQVVMICDVGKQSDKDGGFMDAGLYDYEQLFDTRLGMDKADAIRYKAIRGAHAMTFSGVNLDEEGRPDRWKVQNSYGMDMGIQGHYCMADNWFDEYVLSVVIRKKYAPEEVIKAYEQTPEVIRPSEFY